MGVLPPEIASLFLYMPFIAFTATVQLSYRYLKPRIDSYINEKKTEIHIDLIKWSNKLRSSPELTNELIKELYTQVEKLSSLERLVGDLTNFISYTIASAFGFFTSAILDSLGSDPQIISLLTAIAAILLFVSGIYFIRIHQKVISD